MQDNEDISVRHRGRLLHSTVAALQSDAQADCYRQRTAAASSSSLSVTFLSI